MSLSNLPPGTTDRMIEEQANGPCPTCAKCDHEDVTLDNVLDVDMGVYTVSGTCNDCAAHMRGKGRKRDPEGGIEDVEWEVDDCSHGERDDDDAEEL